jgi:hypothetical protein
VDPGAQYSVDNRDIQVVRHGRMTQKPSRKVLVWFCCFVCVLVALEIGLRIAHVGYPTGGKDLFFTWDPHTGIAPRPGAEGWWHTSEYDVFVHINSQGLRDREHPLQKPPNTFRIAVLGDSYTEALQVPMEKDYSSVLERELTGCPSLQGQTVEVMNFGVNTFTTAQELLRLREKVWSYSPDVVILAFDTGNNVYKNSRTLQQDPSRPYFVEKDGRLVLDDSFAHVPGARARWRWNHLSSWLIKHSRLLQVIAAGTNYLRYGNIDGLIPTGMGLSPALYRDPDDPAWQDAWRVSQDLVAEMHREVSAQGSKFLLLTLSSSIQVDPDPAERQKLMNRVGISDLFYPDHRIQQFAASQGIPVLNLAPYLQKYAEDNKVYVHGQRSADHQGLLNELGHKLVGQLVAQKICGDIISGPASTAVAAEHINVR